MCEGVRVCTCLHSVFSYSVSVWAELVSHFGVGCSKLYWHSVFVTWQPKLDKQTSVPMKGSSGHSNGPCQLGGANWGPLDCASHGPQLHVPLQGRK